MFSDFNALTAFLLGCFIFLCLIYLKILFSLDITDLPCRTQILDVKTICRIWDVEIGDYRPIKQKEIPVLIQYWLIRHDFYEDGFGNRYEVMNN